MGLFFKRDMKGSPPPESFDFKELFIANYSMVLRHLMLITGERSTAEDLAQETFIRLYKCPPKEFTNLSGWLIKVATNLAYNYLRDERKRKQREFSEIAVAVNECFEEDLLQASQAIEVKEILNSLDDRDRICLILKFSGFSYEEIAKITGIKNASVGKVLARSMAKFKKAYQSSSALQG